MRLAIMQPYILPYLGYWQLMAAVDRYVIYDDVNYIKGGWSNHNHILLNGRKHLFSVILQGASPNRYYRDVLVNDNFVKFRKTLQLHYGRAPYYPVVAELLEGIFTHPERDLGHFNLNAFRLILDYLGVHTQLILSSSIPKDYNLHRKDRVLSICHSLQADTYINAIGGTALYDKADFRSHGIDLYFLQPHLAPYPQLKTEEFVPGLSILDVLMNCSPADIRTMLTDYKLI